jgi:hypothetical protein
MGAQRTDTTTTTARPSIRFRLDEVPIYLRRYAIEVDTWAREAGGHPVLHTGTYPAVTPTAN